MPQPLDYTRRRIAIVALGAVLLVGANHRTPMIGTVSIRVDERLLPDVAATWSPPVAVAIGGIGRVASAVGIMPDR